MPSEFELKLWEALKGVRFPGMSRDIVSFGFVSQLKVEGGQVAVELQMSTHNPAAADSVRAEVERVVGGVAGVKAVHVTVQSTRGGQREDAAQKAVAQAPNLVPGVRNLVAVASGKGGVGKSTVAANLAVALSRLGHRTGILDADIYGPSVPTMFGIRDRPRIEGNRIIPFEKFGLRIMSLGFILETDTPVIWRGPMVVRALEQLLGDVEWGELDYMVLDLPPGTGDAQLTLTQKVPLAGAVIVTTPQDVALIDARKGLAMFRKVNVPVIGIVENMSSFVCPHCGEVTDIFKKGGGRRTAELLETSFLGAIPLDPEIVIGGDRGVPIVVSQPDGPHAIAFEEVARAVVEEVERQGSGRHRLSIV
jgi:ATP-binding protein involved in chromosome partitioning